MKNIIKTILTKFKFLLNKKYQMLFNKMKNKKNLILFNKLFNISKKILINRTNFENIERKQIFE